MRISILLTALISLAAYTGVQAQTAGIGAPLLRAEQRADAWQIIDRQVAASTAATQMKTTSNQRLQNIASYHTASGAIADSQAFAWSGTRALPHYAYPYDLYREQVAGYLFYNGSDPLHFYPDERYIRNRADSASVYTYGPSVSNNVFAQFAYTYDGADRTVRKDMWDDQSASSSHLYYYDISYNAAGNITQALKYYDYLGNVPTVYTKIKALYSRYDAMGRLEQDSVEDLVNPGEIDIYRYYWDAAGRDTMRRHYHIYAGNGVEVLSYIDRSTYTASGLLERTIRYQNYLFDTATYIGQIDSFGYTGANVYPTYYRQLIYDTALAVGLQNWYGLNAAGDVAQMTGLQYYASSNIWDTVMRQHVYYNADANADSIVFDLQTASQLEQRAYVVHFRYGAATGVAEAVAELQPKVLTLYPNPAGTSVTLSVAGAVRGRAMIYDMQGRLVAQRGIVQAQQRLDVSGLPAGVYIVRYFGTDRIEGVGRMIKE